MATNSLNIYHFIDSNGFYGAENLILALIIEQQKQGHSPRLISLERQNVEEKPIVSKALQFGIDVFKLKLHSGLNPVSLYPFYKFINSQNIDIIHSHGYKSNVIHAILRLLCNDRTPCIATVHGYTSIKIFSINYLYECLDRQLLKFFDAVAIVDYSMRHRYFRKWPQSEKIHFVPNGIGTSELYNTSPIEYDSEILRFCKSGFTIGTVGRLSPEKNHTSLIKAFDKFSKVFKDTRLILIGDGPYRTAIERQISQSRYRKNILLTGYLSDAANYISLFNAFVLCSHTEGLPIVILEAMKAQTPIISTRVGSVPHVLRDISSALLINKANQESIYEGLLTLYNNYDVYKSSTIEASNRMNSDYSIDITAKRYSTLYNSLL